MMLFSTGIDAQISREVKKERKEMSKMTSSELNKKASKAARKEAKTYNKQKWLVLPGALPIEKQLDRSYLMQYEFDEEGNPKYISGYAVSIGENHDAARMQALELAKQDIAGQIQTELTSLIENTVSNSQLTKERAASITESVMASKSLISQTLGRVMPIVELYRVKNNKNKEVLIRCFINYETAMNSAREVVRNDLRKRGADLHKELDKLF